MQQLTGLDASFLAFETANSTGHVGGVSVLDPGDAPKPLTLARLTEVLADRLQLVPVLRRKLLNVPLGLDQPYWIDDADFDIEYHVRELAVPSPGSDAQLCEQVARLHARPLDRSRPLWEIYLITGLARDRAAVYTKIHHSAIDGASGTELLTVLFDLDPGGRELPAAKPFRPERGPSPAAMAALAATRLIAMIRVSIRDRASKGALGNKVSAMLATLPTHVIDPDQRLQIVHAATKIAKAQQAAIPQGLVDQISDFAPPALAARAARVVFATGLLHRLPPFNICISNVPGPNVPVYLCGAKLLAHYPVSVITDGQGLNITLVGYLGQLHFGLVSCRELVPDIDTLAGYLVEELELLLKAADQRAAR